MEISLHLTCPCRQGFSYSNKQTFTSHRKSARHINWENGQDKREVMSRSKEFENENSRLKMKVLELERDNMALRENISQLKQTEIDRLNKKKRGFFSRS
jgi:predicted RNase H-like nuclease (RuvC/YqgF family)